MLIDPSDFYGMKQSTMEVIGVHQLSGYWHSSKYLHSCSAEERNSYRFEI